MGRRVCVCVCERVKGGVSVRGCVVGRCIRVGVLVLGRCVHVGRLWARAPAARWSAHLARPTHTPIHPYTHTRMHEYPHPNTHTPLYPYTHTSIRPRIYDPCTHTHIHPYTYTPIHIHTHPHTGDPLVRAFSTAHAASLRIYTHGVHTRGVGRSTTVLDAYAWVPSHDLVRRRMKKVDQRFDQTGLSLPTHTGIRVRIKG